MAAPQLHTLNITVLKSAARKVRGLVAATFLATSALGLAYATPSLAQTASATLFQNVNVFDSKNAKMSKGMNVLVEGNTIAAMSDKAIKAPDGALVVDGKGKTLMPGLIDAHVHIFMMGKSQKDLEEAKDPATLHDVAGMEAEAMLMRGFTAARDVGGPTFITKKAIDDGKRPGPRIYPSGGLISQTSGHGDFRGPNDRSRRFGGTISPGELLGVGFIADGRDEVLTATRENLRSGATQIKVLAGGGAASTYDPLDVAQYTLDELKAAVDAASDWNTYVTVHAYTVRAVRRAVEAGVKCIEHGQLLDEATIKLLAKKGVWLSLQALDPAPPTAAKAVQIKKQKVVDGTDLAFRMAKKHKVKLAWGTDYLFFPAQNVKQNADILKLGKWFSPAEALRIVTYNNAQLLALSGERNPYPGKMGVVEVGAFADLLLIDGDPTSNFDLIGDPLKNYKIIMKDGKIYKNTL